MTPPRQRPLFCPCGQGAPALAGLCRPCDRKRRHSRACFGGYRELVLARDGGACAACGGNASCLHVHHRRPGCHEPDFLVSLCAACHARVHRLAAIRRRWFPERLVELWAEQHPGRAVQLQLSLVSLERVSLEKGAPG